MPRPVDVIKAMSKLADESSIMVIYETDKGDLVTVGTHTMVVYRIQTTDTAIGEVNACYRPIGRFPTGVDRVNVHGDLKVILKDGSECPFKKLGEGEFSVYREKVMSILDLIKNAKETDKNMKTTAPAIALVGRMFGKDEVSVSWLLSENGKIGLLKLENTDGDLTVYTTSTRFD